MNIVWVVDCWGTNNPIGSDQIKQDIIDYLDSNNHEVALMTYDEQSLEPMLAKWCSENQNRLIDIDLDNPFQDLTWNTMTWVGFSIDLCISQRPCGIFNAGSTFPDRVKDMTVRLDLMTDSNGHRWSPKKFRRFLPNHGLAVSNLSGINLITA